MSGLVSRPRPPRRGDGAGFGSGGDDQHPTIQQQLQQVQQQNHAYELRIAELENQITTLTKIAQVAQTDLKQREEEFNVELTRRLEQEQRRSRERELQLQQELRQLQHESAQLKALLESQAEQLLSQQHETAELRAQKDAEIVTLNARIERMGDESEALWEARRNLEAQLTDLQAKVAELKSTLNRKDHLIQQLTLRVIDLGIHAHKSKAFRNLVTRIVARRFVVHWQMRKYGRTLTRAYAEVLKRLIELRHFLSTVATGVTSSETPEQPGVQRRRIDLLDSHDMSSYGQGQAAGDEAVDSLDPTLESIWLNQVNGLDRDRSMPLGTSLATLPKLYSAPDMTMNASERHEDEAVFGEAAQLQKEGYALLTPALHAVKLKAEALSRLLRMGEIRNAQLVREVNQSNTEIIQLKAQLTILEQNKTQAMQESAHWKAKYQLACRRLCSALLANKLISASGSRLATIVPVVAKNLVKEDEKELAGRIDSEVVQEMPENSPARTRMDKARSLNTQRPASAKQRDREVDERQVSVGAAVTRDDSVLNSSTTNSTSDTERLNWVGIRLAGHSEALGAQLREDTTSPSVSLSPTLLSHPGTGRILRTSRGSGIGTVAEDQFKELHSSRQTLPPSVYRAYLTTASRFSTTKRRSSAKSQEAHVTENEKTVRAAVPSLPAETSTPCHIARAPKASSDSRAVTYAQHAGFQVAPIALCRAPSGKSESMRSTKPPIRAPMAPFSITRSRTNSTSAKQTGSVGAVAQVATKAGWATAGRSSNPRRNPSPRSKPLATRLPPIEIPNQSLSSYSWPRKKKAESVTQSRSSSTTPMSETAIISQGNSTSSEIVPGDTENEAQAVQVQRIPDDSPVVVKSQVIAASREPSTFTEGVDREELMLERNSQTHPQAVNANELRSEGEDSNGEDNYEEAWELEGGNLT